MAFNGIFQSLTQLVFVGHVIFHCIKVEPVAMIIRTDFAVLAPQIAPRRELFNRAANWHQRFHF
ncbi:Uncharacterised protein [Shigella sonnei]|nr:Uncharacterised protein [Shigella sonnei]